METEKQITDPLFRDVTLFGLRVKLDPTAPADYITLHPSVLQKIEESAAQTFVLLAESQDDLADAYARARRDFPMDHLPHTNC
jgi:hypothetical protein